MKVTGRTLCAAVFTFAVVLAWPDLGVFGQARQGAPSTPRGIQPDKDHPILPIGSPAPDFALPGIDGRTHRLGDYASAKVLAVVFESNHCPMSILYEERIRKIHEDYRGKGVALVAINPNNPNAVRLDEQGYTDVSDSLEEMKIRSAFRKRSWPFLYDGETQTTAAKFGAVATPHIYIFDQARRLQYQGRIDDHVRPDLVKSHDARNALDALLAGRPVPVQNTGAFGCATKWLTKATGVEQEKARIAAEPVTLEATTAEQLKALRANATGKHLVVNFWSTACAACTAQFPGLQTTFRMYRNRSGRYAHLQLVTVSMDPPAAREKVLAFLRAQQASSQNVQLDSVDRAALQAVWGPAFNPATSFTVVVAPDGKIVYQHAGRLDILTLRRAILASLPDVPAYPGQQQYWAGRGK
jgi:peroxiredoxin